MSNYLDHLNKRKTHYNNFVHSDHFNSTPLRGLHHIELNVTENCNRKCSFCPRSNPSSYPNIKQYMSLDTAKCFAEKCIESLYQEEIHLTGFGEPLLNPNILELIRLIRIHGINNYINLTTNGDLLNLKLVKDLYKMGVSCITVSCYEDTKLDYYNSLFANQPPTKYFIRHLWKTYNEGFANRNNSKNINIKSKCNIPFYKMFIDYDGKILLCSNDWFRKENLKLNIHNDSLLEIWNNCSLNKIRNNLMSEQRIDAACSTCNINGTLVGEESVKIIWSQQPGSNR